MSALVNVNGFDIEVLPHGDTWKVSNEQVAQAFGVTENAIRQQKSKGTTEYKQGVHFVSVSNPHSENLTEKTMWTRKGVITLGFKLRETPQTIAFRDWASDFILDKSETIIPELSYEETMANALTMAHNKVLELKQEILNQVPKVTYADAITGTTNPVSLREWINSLKSDKGLEVGERKVIEFLESKYLYREKKRNKLRAYSQYSDLFTLVPTVNTTESGSFEHFQLKITGKGQVIVGHKVLDFFSKQSA